MAFWTSSGLPGWVGTRCNDAMTVRALSSSSVHLHPHCHSRPCHRRTRRYTGNTAARWGPAAMMQTHRPRQWQSLAAQLPAPLLWPTSPAASEPRAAGDLHETQTWNKAIIDRRICPWWRILTWTSYTASSSPRHTAALSALVNLLITTTISTAIFQVISMVRQSQWNWQ